jgi:hypothetical protein
MIDQMLAVARPSIGLCAALARVERSLDFLALKGRMEASGKPRPRSSSPEQPDLGKTSGTAGQARLEPSNRLDAPASTN